MLLGVDIAIIVIGVRCINRSLIIRIAIFERKCTPYGSLFGSLAHVVDLYGSVSVRS